MKNTYLCLVVFCLMSTFHSLPTPTTEYPGIKGVSTGIVTAGDMQEESSGAGEEENDIDPREISNEEQNKGLEPYTCSSDAQCANGGTCVETKEAGKICNCSKHHLGPFCEFSANYIEYALRVHPVFKVTFANCMTKSGQTAGIDASGVLKKCGGGQNLCWLEEGGIKGLECFFWCLTNGMHMSLTEAQPSEQSRLQLYAEVFQKLTSERHMKDVEFTPRRPKGVPIYTMEISFYDNSQSSNSQQYQLGAPFFNPFSILSSLNLPSNAPSGSTSTTDLPEFSTQSTPTTTEATNENMGPVTENEIEDFLSNFPSTLEPYNPDYSWLFPGPFQNPPPGPASWPTDDFLDNELQDVMTDMSVVEETGDDDSDESELTLEHYQPSYMSQFGPTNMRGRR